MENIDFTPFPIISGCHTQTILGSCLNFHRHPVSETRLVELPDGDKVALEISTPSDWKGTNPTVLMVHGLCGSHRSTYLIRMTHKLMAKGWRVVRYNMRGCGTGKGHAREIYHSGRSDDLYEAIKSIKEEEPESDITLIGFSLGGNVSLKLAGELSIHAPKLLKQIIAVSPPTHLHSSVKRLDTEVNKFYQRYFLKHLKEDMFDRHKRFPEIKMPDLPKTMSFYEFDELYIAPQSGFKSAIDYYTKCSSFPLIPHITIPCKILFAKDDPIVDSTSLDDTLLPGNVKVFVTDHGGHMGFLGSPRSDGGFHWMDAMLLRWLDLPESQSEE